METLKGTVSRVLWSSPEEGNHYKVFKLRCKGNSFETITGDFEELIEGADIEVHGVYKDHPRYGRGFKATAYTFSFNKDSTQSISLYLQSIAKFLGPKRSFQIASYFGSELEDIIEKYPEKLTEIENIGPKVASNLVEAWYEHREEKNVRIFLHGLGLSQKNIKRILTTFGVDSENKIKENPYLLSLVGFGFSTCDFIAKKLNFNPDDPIRIRYFIIYALKLALTNGHLYLYDHQILKIFNSYNERTTFHFKKGEINIEDIKKPIEILINEGYVYKEGDRYYELENFFFENESSRILSLIKEKEDYCKLSQRIDVEEYISNFENEQKSKTGIKDFYLSEEQRDAVRSFVTEKILIITGNPGTGKTTVVKSFVELLIKNNVSFELLAPTGIAAKKLGNTAEFEAYTIHRRLGYKGSEWSYDANEKYNTDVVIVDEISMVDMEVFYRLVSALYNHTKLVFVGDNDQLPSVGPGRVLNELIRSKCIKTISLKNIFRQEEQSDIIKEAKNIKEGNVDLSLFSSRKEDDIWFIRHKNSFWIEERIVEFARDLKSSIKQKGGNKTFQIITPRNTGPLSVETLNIALQSALNPKRPNEREVQLNTCVIRKGDRVLIKKNNYNLDVYNGDIGKVINIVKADIIIEVEDYGGSKEVSIPMELAEDMIKLGYCVTVHKSQGSEYDIVILPIIKSHGKKILQRNLLYTALTRAKKKVIVFGQGGAIVDAINNDKIQERNTLFSERIKKWMKKEGTSLQQLYSNPSNYQNAKTLKRLLLSEEKASLDTDTADSSSKEKRDLKKTNTKTSSVAQSSKQPMSRSESLDQMLKELEPMLKENT